MLGFSFNKAKQSSQSQSQASSFDVGYGYSGNESLSDSLSRSRSSSTQAVAFEDLFRDLYTNASGAAGKVSALVPQLTQQANLLFSGGVGFLDQLQQRDDTALNGQIDALGDDLGRFLREEVNPALTSRGVATGTLGGGRQGVAQGVAARGVAEEFAQGVTGLRVADRAARDSAAATALSSLPGLFDLAGGALGAELMPYQALGGILGGPTTLTRSVSESEAIAEAISRAFGEDFQYGTSQSTSSSSSKGKSFGFGIGGLGGGGTS